MNSILPDNDLPPFFDIYNMELLPSVGKIEYIHIRSCRNVQYNNVPNTLYKKPYKYILRIIISGSIDDVFISLCNDIGSMHDGLIIEEKKVIRENGNDTVYIKFYFGICSYLHGRMKFRIAILSGNDVIYH
jgi:hypothetical protein